MEALLRLSSTASNNMKYSKIEKDNNLGDVEIVNALHMSSSLTLADPKTDRNQKNSEYNNVLFDEPSEISDVVERKDVPNMWTKDFIGLYCQYAAVGLLYGTSGALMPLCAYVYDGATNVCANSTNIVTFAWNMKIFYAMITDSYRPFGMRRKPWMVVGWTLTLMILFLLAVSADQLDTSSWLAALMIMQFCVMLSDVPADGYSVELGQLESKEERGQILATGQRVRFIFSMVAGVIQTFLLNGPTTNSSDCEISWKECWAWGLNINSYYALIFLVVLVLTIPVFWLKELDASHIPVHNFSYYCSNVWGILQNLTTLYLLIFVIGTYTLTGLRNNASIAIQYYIIKLTNFQSGIDTITSYGATVLAVYVFQRYLIRQNWRYTQYGSVMISALFGLIWIAPYYGVGGTRDPWFTIFIDLDQSFVTGLSQVLYSMAVIELAQPGLEATTYELIVTVGNSAQFFNGIVSTQLLTPLKASSCNDGLDACPSNTVVTSSTETYEASDGPNRFTQYTLVITMIGLASCCLFTPFLPASQEQCKAWRKKGDLMGASVLRGKIALTLSAITILYGVIAAILLLDVKTSCLPLVGGEGC